MRVVAQFGLRAGHVIDVPPLVARALLADGRAVPVPDSEVESAPRTDPPSSVSSAPMRRGRR